MPGAASALAALADMDGVVQSVVTGNIRAVAEIKLQMFGLDTHIQFAYGGYGEDHDDRAELVHTAIAGTRNAADTAFAQADILLIGDTPADVAAGRAAGVPVMAVTTGRTPAADLADAGATATVRDLWDHSRCATCSAENAHGLLSGIRYRFREDDQRGWASAKKAAASGDSRDRLRLLRLRRMVRSPRPSEPGQPSPPSGAAFRRAGGP
ncbi:haloacid dehalogenase-like hydrolase [Streptomyces sp. NBC_01433]|nr:haloacid dehalogenase-like hydrolase [Streptomyces sp. NBC_01433]